jgi:uncharacterized protein YbjT (DUF2867 family)
MKLLIFGATGATGLHLVRQALVAGHHVTAFVREPARLGIAHPLLTPVVGDVMQAPSVDAAFGEYQAVLCALGSMPEGKSDAARRQPKVPVCSVGTRHILEAMARHGCQRIVVESSASVGSSQAGSVLGASTLIRTLLRDVMDDKEIQEAAIIASAAEWTIVRPVKLGNGPARGRVQSGESLRWSLLSSVTREDVAAFMLAAIADRGSFRRALTLKA